MVSEKAYTYADLLLKTSGTSSDQIRIGILFAETHQQWATLVEQAIDWISLDFAESPHHRKDRDEDALTIDVVTSLKSLGFKANHDEDIGGHCDIVVRGSNNFLWAGEAKIHEAYDWLVSGYRQIIDRYTTGNPGQDVGGLVIYVKAANTLQVMSRWKVRFEAEFPDAIVSICEKNPLALVSVAAHPRSGLPFRLRHVPISLHHEPTDQKAKRRR